MTDDKICIGVVTGSYGVRGEARVKSFCTDPTAIANYGPLWDETATQQFTIRITRPVKGGFAVRLGGVATKEQADDLKGLKLFTNRASLPSLPDDEYYYSDLIGMDVFDTGGELMGRVNAVQDHGAGDLLEIRLAGGSETALIPFTKDGVPTIDLSQRRIVADPPAGILPGTDDA